MSKKPQKSLNINSIALTGPKQVVQTQSNVAPPKTVVQDPKPSNPSPQVQKSNAVARPSPSSLTSPSQKAPVQRFDYKDPPFRLSEGVFKRLYEEHNMAQYYSPQISPRGQISQAFELKSARRDNSMPHFSQTERTNNFRYDDYHPGPVFPNTPFKQIAPAANQYSSAPRDFAPSQNLNTYQPVNNAHYSSRPIDLSQPMIDRYENTKISVQNHVSQWQPVDPSRYDIIEPERYEVTTLRPSVGFKAPKENRDAIDREYERIQESKNNNITRQEIVSPTQSSSTPIFRGGRYATLEHSSKMRNPLYVSHDFSDYNKKRAHLFRPQDYNYSTVDPIAPRDFLKSHKSAIALAKRYDMEQQTKIHPQLGLLGVAPGERRSTPILRPFADGTNPATQNHVSQWQQIDPARYEVIEGTERYEAKTVPQNHGSQWQPIDPARYDVIPVEPEVTPLKANVGYTVNPQPYQQPKQQRQEVASARQNYSNSLTQLEKPQNRSLFAPSLQQPQTILKGINKQPVMIMPPPSLKTNTIEKDYSKFYGQYAESYRSPISYPW